VNRPAGTPQFLIAGLNDRFCVVSTSFAYVRLFADAEGNSHIEQDLTLRLEPTNFVPPAPVIHVSPLQLATAYAFLSPC
jgi:hypothetical protein